MRIKPLVPREVREANLLHTGEMVVHEGVAEAEAGRAAPLAALAASARALAEGTTLAETLDGIARAAAEALGASVAVARGDRKSTRLNSSHLVMSYAVFCV